MDALQPQPDRRPVIRDLLEICTNANDAASNAVDTASDGTSGTKDDDGGGEWLSFEDAADKLQLSYDAIQQLVSSGDLTAYPDGALLKFKQEDIAARLTKKETEDDGACLGCLFVALVLWYYDVHIMAWDVVAWPFRTVAGLFE